MRNQVTASYSPYSAYSTYSQPVSHMSETEPKYGSGPLAPAQPQTPPPNPRQDCAGSGSAPKSASNKNNKSSGKHDHKRGRS